MRILCSIKNKKEELESDTSNKCDLIVEEETETHKTEMEIDINEIENWMKDKFEF